MKNFLISLLLVFCLQPVFSQYSRPDSLSGKKVRFLLPVFIGAGTAIAWAGTYRYMDMPVRSFSRENKSAVPDLIAYYAQPFGKGRYLQFGSGGIILTGILLNDRRLAKAGAAALTGLFLNNIVTSNLKSAFERSRPYTDKPYNTFGGPENDNANRSLPSAHTSNAFTAATVLASVYKEKKWAAPVAYGLATLVGFSRIYHDQHWASDVLAGAVIGYACGKLSLAGWNWLDNKGLFFFPSFGRNENSLTLLYKF